MSQPVANDPYVHLTGTAVGTSVIVSGPANWNSYTVGTATTGSVSLFDCAGTAGTTATNLLATFNGALRDATPLIHLKRGMVALVSGTIDAIIGVG